MGRSVTLRRGPTTAASRARLPSGGALALLTAAPGPPRPLAWPRRKTRRWRPQHRRSGGSVRGRARSRRRFVRPARDCGLVWGVSRWGSGSGSGSTLALGAAPASSGVGSGIGCGASRAAGGAPGASAKPLHRPQSSLGLSPREKENRTRRRSVAPTGGHVDAFTWTLSASGAWGLLYFKAVGSWRLVAVGGWRWLAAVGGWRLVVLGPIACQGCPQKYNSGCVTTALVRTSRSVVRLRTGQAPRALHDPVRPARPVPQDLHVVRDHPHEHRHQRPQRQRDEPPRQRPGGGAGRGGRVGHAAHGHGREGEHVGPVRAQDRGRGEEAGPEGEQHQQHQEDVAEHRLRGHPEAPGEGGEGERRHGRGREEQEEGRAALLLRRQVHVVQHRRDGDLRGRGVRHEAGAGGGGGWPALEGQGMPKNGCLFDGAKWWFLCFDGALGSSSRPHFWVSGPKIAFVADGRHERNLPSPPPPPATRPAHNKQTNK